MFKAAWSAVASVLVLSVVYYVFVKDAPPWREMAQNLTHPIGDSCIDLPNSAVPYPHESPLSCKDLLEAIYKPVFLNFTREELDELRIFDVPATSPSPPRPVWAQPECYETDGKRIIWLCEEVERANREIEKDPRRSRAR